MAIPMQGSWTVSVKSKSAAFLQRFVIAGADSGNGTYTGEVATPAVSVTGANWRIQIQNNPGSGFIDSADQIKFPTVSGLQYHFDIESNDAGGDEDFNDLILTCSTPVTDTDFIVYGNATSYSGRCFFPCWRGWFVIDSPAALARALGYPAMRKAIETVYPERVRIKPIPQPDPPPFVPMLIPLNDDRLIPAKRVQLIRLPKEEPKLTRASKATDVAGQAFSVRTAAITSFAEKSGATIDRIGIGSILDKIFPLCSTETLAGFPISFEEYDRTSAELGGGAYTGTGTREALGQAATDRNGNYVFRFSRSIAEFIEESNIDVGVAEDEVVQSMPDLIAKLLDAMAPGGVAFESAPYWNVPVLKRIDLCFPKPARTGCQGGRNIQALGAIRLGISDTVFDGDGRITCTDTTLSDVPQARCAAWFSRVRLFGCFIGSGTAVTQYTIRHRRKNMVTGVFGPWEFYQEGMFLQKIGFLIPQQIGPFDRMLEVVNGGGLVAAKAYDNIEQNLAWAASDWFLKAVISTGGGTPAYAPSPGTVQFRIQGYDAAGNFVVGATDTVTMYIDNTVPDLDLPSVQMGAQTGGDCALFSLTGEPDPAKLTVVFKAVQNQGFLGRYDLTVRKGNIGGFAIATTTGPAGETSGALSGAYTHTSAINCGQLFGTRPPDEPLADAADYVTAYIIPASGNWLAPGQPFCTFSVNVGATMRRTNGYNSAEDPFGPVQYLLGIQQ
ncbi:MAG: hypothetical protein A2Z07_00530 [Armatimonadetes bacterium RBG_16_67_12]|nr:MAG: hypothetical protein A2Z07_00530 [Armatimonadetes bacterium RBG_16_67_12]